MKLNIAFLTFLLFCTNVYCQQLNVLITVDDVITASYNLSESSIKVENDTIRLNYEMGRFKINETDLERLQLKNQNTEIILNFQYFTNCPVQKTYQYELKLKLGLLLQQYFLIKVFNYSSYPKSYVTKSGYGYEYISPLGSKGLAKNKRLKRNPCIE